VEARDELSQRGLAAARLADERDHSAGGDRQADVVERRHIAAAPVAEGDPAQLYSLAQRAERDGVRFLRQLVALVHHLPDVARGGERLLHPVVQARELAHRVVAGEEEEEEG
jgi:hypothetical protein